MLLLAVLTLSRQAAGAISATTHPNVIAALESPVFVDTREADTCAGGSVEGALCMAPSQFLHPDGASASFRDINWLARRVRPGACADRRRVRRRRVRQGFRRGNALSAGSISRGGLAGRRRGASRLPDTGRREASRHVCGAVSTPIPMRDEYIALDDDVRSFFGTGTVTRLEYPQSFEEAGWLSGPQRDTPLLYRHDGEGSLLLLARDTREAVVHLVRLLLRDPTAPARVHLDGLRGRSVETSARRVPASGAFRGWPRGWAPSRFSASPSWLARWLEGADDHSVHRRPPRLRRLSARILRCLPEEGRGILHLLHR